MVECVRPQIPGAPCPVPTRAGEQSRVSWRMLPRCSTRLCSVRGISPSSVDSSLPATFRTVPAARQAGLAAVTSNPSDVADLLWSAVSTSRRFEPRVSRSSGRRRRAGSKGISGSGGSVGSSAAVSQARAGATTWPGMFLWGRSLTLRSPGCSGPVRSFGTACLGIVVCAVDACDVQAPLHQIADQLWVGRGRRGQRHHDAGSGD